MGLTTMSSSSHNASRNVGESVGAMNIGFTWDMLESRAGAGIIGKRLVQGRSLEFDSARFLDEGADELFLGCFDFLVERVGRSKRLQRRNKKN